jgi:hypothetical protein
VLGGHDKKAQARQKERMRKEEGGFQDQANDLLEKISPTNAHSTLLYWNLKENVVYSIIVVKI